MAVFKVLLVEDEPIWQSILQDKLQIALKNIGHLDDPIKVVATYIEALNALNKEPPWDLLVTDISLPSAPKNLETMKEMGKELVERARQLNLPIIVVSGKATPQEVRDFFKIEEIYDFFSKEDFERAEFIKEVQEILGWALQIIDSLRENNSASLTIFPEERRDFIYEQFCKEYEFLNLIYHPDTATLEVSERDRMNQFKNIWNQVKTFLAQNDIEAFRQENDKLTKLFCETLAFKVVKKSATFGQVYGQIIDTSNPVFQLNIRPEFPIIYICKNEFFKEDVNQVKGLLNQLGIHANFFALLVGYQNTQRLRQQVRQSVYKNDFIVLNFNQLWEILAAKYPIQRLTNFILEQIDLVTVSPYTVAGPVSEKMFFGRAEEEKTLLQNISRNDYALLANRRMGKTSLLNKIYPRLKKVPYYQVFFCDLQAVHDYESFYQVLALTFLEFQEEINRLDRQSPLEFRELVNSIKQKNGKQQIIIIFDEVDELLNYDLQFNEVLFKTFRSLSQSKNIRFIFSGTTTLVERVVHPDSPLFNFCEGIIIELLDDKPAQELITVPMKNLGVKFENELDMVENILSITVRHPNVIQYICNQLIKIINQKQKRTITQKDLDKVINSQKFHDNFESLIWGQSTDIEKLIVYLMWSDSEFTEAQVIEEFKRRNLATKDIKESLETLQIYSTLRKKDDKYFFTFREFAKLMEKRSDIETLQAEYLQKVGGVQT